MASLTYERRRGTYKVQFFDLDGKRKALYLGNVSKRTGGWYRDLVEDCLAAIVTEKKDLGLLDRLGGLDPGMLERLAALGLIEKPTPDEDLELAKFLDAFIDKHDAKDSTKLTYKRTKERLLGHFDAKKPITAITLADADDWATYLRKKTKLSKATINKTIGLAKQFFNWAVKREMLTRNPFSELVVGSQTNGDRQFFIDRETAQKVLDACPNNEWRVLFALSRFGALRCPSEHLALKWSDINWEREVMTVHSPKTEHHEGGATRVVPLFKELRPYLDAAFFDPAREGEYVITATRDTGKNLRTHLRRIITRAGVAIWPKLWQNLRASRATELARVLPGHVAAKICGHSQDVAKDHYWQVTDEDLKAAMSASTDDNHHANHKTLLPGTAGQGEGDQENQRDTVFAEKTEVCGDIEKSPNRPGRIRTRDQGIMSPLL